MNRAIILFSAAILLVLGAVFSPVTIDAAGNPGKSFRYDDHGRRDPFWRLVNANGTIVNYEKDLVLNDLTLEGIILESHGDNLAIINGHIVRVSDELGAFTILKIEKDVVVLTKGTDKFELRLKKEE